MWNILDLDAPGGVELWKELLLVFVGTGVMLWTGTYFSNAGKTECRPLFNPYTASTLYVYFEVYTYAYLKLKLHAR